MLAITLCVAAGIGVAAKTGTPHDGDPPATVTVTTTVRTVSSYRGVSAPRWAAKYRQMRHVAYQRLLAEARLTRAWRPTVFYALRLASAVYGIPYSDLLTVSHCESTWNPYARNGKQLGLFQLGWRPFGFSPFDPVANALSAAQTVKADGSWRQWVCKP